MGIRKREREEWGEKERSRNKTKNWRDKEKGELKRGIEKNNVGKVTAVIVKERNREKYEIEKVKVLFKINRLR